MEPRPPEKAWLHVRCYSAAVARASYTHGGMAIAVHKEWAVDSCVRGHHVSKVFWSPTLGEELSCERESGNPVDSYAVAIVKDAAVVEHVPKKISAACSLFLHNNGIIRCTVTGNRRYSGDLLQGGLEMPCKLPFRGVVRYVEKVYTEAINACVSRL